MPQIEKSALYQICEDLLQSRMKETEAAMVSAQESANSNEKSSMGDKYETGRAMSQLERDMHAKQLAVLQEEFARLKKINISLTHLQAETGALVQTENKLYWISISLGQIAVGEQAVMVVSPQSPVAKNMLGKKAGDSFEINGIKQKINLIR